MKIYYGIPQKYIDVTSKSLSLYDVNTQCIIINKNDLYRAYIFGDPLPGILKHIIVELNGIYTLYDSETNISIPYDINKYKLEQIHQKLIFTGGDINEEYEEQIMAVKFISPKAKVLELGANIGRNTLVIGSILENSSNLITFETSPIWANILKQNRDKNNMKFTIVNAALSKTPLYQKEWVCLPTPGDGFKPVSIVDYQYVLENFGKPDTLVADCEGSLLYIFQEFPEILHHVNLIIMENDYSRIEDKEFVDKCLIDNGFKCIYKQKLGPEFIRVCQDNFYETWCK